MTREEHFQHLKARTVQVAKQWIRELEASDSSPTALDNLAVTSAAAAAAAQLIVDRGSELAADQLESG